MNSEQRIAAMIGVPLILVVIVGYLIVGVGGGGGGGSSGGGVFDSGPPDLAGDWRFTVNLTDEYDAPEEVVVIDMDLRQDDEGNLIGDGGSTYDGQFYDVDVIEGTDSYVTEEGEMSLRINGMTSSFEGFDIGMEDEEVQRNELDGWAAGELLFEVDSTRPGGYAEPWDFTAERTQ